VPWRRLGRSDHTPPHHVQRHEYQKRGESKVGQGELSYLRGISSCALYVRHRSVDVVLVGGFRIIVSVQRLLLLLPLLMMVMLVRLILFERMIYGIDVATPVLVLVIRTLSPPKGGLIDHIGRISVPQTRAFRVWVVPVAPGHRAFVGYNIGYTRWRFAWFEYPCLVAFRQESAFVGLVGIEVFVVHHDDETQKKGGWGESEEEVTEVLRRGGGEKKKGGGEERTIDSFFLFFALPPNYVLSSVGGPRVIYPWGGFKACGRPSFFSLLPS